MNNLQDKLKSQQEPKQGLFNQWSDRPIDASLGTLKVLGVVVGMLAALSILFFVIFPGAFIIVAMALFDNPNNFKLPYNGIDFQKIAYIDNQFVMYGIDYDKSGLKQLVIFNSTDGKKWDKSSVEIDNNNQGTPISVAGTFNYFNGKCYLIGAIVQPLVAADCKHWQIQTVSSLESNNNYYLYQAHSSAIANNTLYVGGEKGVYKTTNGTIWSKELLPYPSEESNPNHFENSFYSMAVGDNKLITETNWWQDKTRRGLIYSKNLTTNKWSYEVYPVPVTNITRGKDRFVAMTESRALVLIDGKNDYINMPVTPSEFSSLSYGLNGKFIGTNPITLSIDGLKWLIGKNFGGGNIACNNEICITSGHEYHVAGSIDGENWEFFEFNNKNPKPHWWRRFF